MEGKSRALSGEPSFRALMRSAYIHHVLTEQCILWFGTGMYTIGMRRPANRLSSNKEQHERFLGRSTNKRAVGL